MKHKRKTTALLFIAICICILAAMTLYCAHSREPDLLSIATKVADVDQLFTYAWTSDHEMVYKVTDRIQLTANWSGHFELVDFRKRSHTLMKGLTDALVAHRMSYDWTGPNGFLTVSPDGRWLKWDRSDPTG
jgi:hypothetical protein